MGPVGIARGMGRIFGLDVSSVSGAGAALSNVDMKVATSMPGLVMTPNNIHDASRGNT